MRPALILLAVVVAGAGAVVLFTRATRPAPPPVPALSADWTDAAVIELVGEKRKAVEDAPRSGPAWGELGMAFHAHEKLADAEACYRAAVRFGPPDARWPYQLAQVVKATAPDEAIKLLTECLTLPQPTPAHKAAAELTLARLLADNDRGAEADEIVKRVYAADPANPWAAYRAGATLADRDNPAGERILMGLARNPYAQKKAAAALAAYYRRAGRTAQAEGFEYATSLLPQDYVWANPYDRELSQYQRGQHVLVEVVTSHEQSGNHQAAVETAQRLAASYPGPRTQLMLGRALVNLTDFGAAVPVLEDAVAADPNLVMAHAFLGVARFGMAEEAEEAGRPARAVDEYTKAVAALGRAVALKPDYAVGYYYMARALLRLNRPADALQAARDCIARRPEEWEGYVVLSEVHQAAGRKADAVAALEQAVKLANPREPRPKQALAKLKAGG